MFAVNVPRTAALPPSLLANMKPAPTLGSFDGVRVLCIDNEPAVLEGMEALLKGWNCTVETTGSAEAVVLRRMGFPSSASLWPSVIMADYHLDNGTGVEAIARIRAVSKIDIPAIIITADHSIDVQREIRSCGFTQLKKPIKPAALRAALAQNLMHGKITPPATPQSVEPERV